MSSTSKNITDYRKLNGTIIDKFYEFDDVTSSGLKNKVHHWKIKVGVIPKDFADSYHHEKNINNLLQNTIYIDQKWFESINELQTIKNNKSIPLYAFILVDKWIDDQNNTKDIKLHEVEPYFIEKGKNIGKKNCTNAFTQALSEAHSMRLKYINRHQQSKEISTITAALAATSVASTTSAVSSKSNNDIEDDDGINDNNAINDTLSKINLYPPMLAQKREENLNEIIYIDNPALVFESPHFQQRKYDGVRAVITINNNDIYIYSRELKEYKQFQHLREEVYNFINNLENVINSSTYWKTLFNNKPDCKIYLDGELYKHGSELQDISGQARKQKSKQNLLLDYFCYDLFIPSIPDLKYSLRKKLLDDGFDSYIDLYDHDPIYIKQVETWQPNNEFELMQNHEKCLSEGFEGSMIRLDKPYKYSYKGYHCSDLLKIKPKLDDEFEIIDFYAAEKGKAKGCLMWKCKVKDKTETDNQGNSIIIEGKQFDVTPMGSLEDRKKMFIELQKINPISKKNKFIEKYKGKMLTVKFDNYSKDGKPIRGNAIAIRDYE